ncbi:MAG: PadR family transcriptional regulator [Thermoanaerobaculia bacterium]|nr:PadR family transcriptional regulator [Thermoanaerobaculia bacterium]
MAQRPLTPAMLQIGFVLAEAPAHGYAIMREVESSTPGQIRLGPGTLYRSLQRMEVDGLIEEIVDPPEHGTDDERRRSYRLTAQGRMVLEAEVDRLRDLVRRAEERGLLGSSKSGCPR